MLEGLGRFIDNLPLPAKIVLAIVAGVAQASAILMWMLWKAKEAKGKSFESRKDKSQ